MIRLIERHDNKLVRELYELQRAAYLVEAEYLSTKNIPPLNESFDQFQACGELFFGYFVGEKLAAAISIIQEEKSLTICRLVVHPNHFRKGVGQQLLRYIDRQFADSTAINVATGRDNIPAIKLYLKNGYQAVGDVEVEPGLFIRMFSKVK
ncbi:GNAT family N-acetyltransferase [Neobacillus sp. SM06]|uniref:GNAT family N-acetyltransferase n=1 Tax=Neobacillus sp. SM06 TaxID=3422492 RepID=UPI003D2DC36D